jgi:hypothetical protein
MASAAFCEQELPKLSLVILKGSILNKGIVNRAS